MTTQSPNTSTYNNPLNDLHFIFLPPPPPPPPPHLCSYTQLNYWCEVIISFISGTKHLFQVFLIVPIKSFHDFCPFRIGLGCLGCSLRAHSSLPSAPSSHPKHVLRC